MKKLLCDDGTGRDNDIQEHVPLKNDLMKIKQILFIKTVLYRFPFHTLFFKVNFSVTQKAAVAKLTGRFVCH